MWRKPPQNYNSPHGARSAKSSCFTLRRHLFMGQNNDEDTV